MYCYIFGAMPITNFDFLIQENDLVIAADAGLKNTEKFNIEPDMIIGDFDSLKNKPSGANVIAYPVEKDDTDTILAVKAALEKGFKNFRIFGCIGGRLDHTFANTQAASYIVENGGTVVFFGNNENFTVLKNNSINFSSCCKGNISVFAVSDTAKGVTIKNLYYNCENIDLTPNFPLGVSNKFIGQNSSVSVNNGKLLIIWENNNSDFKIGGNNQYG